MIMFNAYVMMTPFPEEEGRFREVPVPAWGPMESQLGHVSLPHGATLLPLMKVKCIHLSGTMDTCVSHAF